MPTQWRPPVHALQAAVPQLRDHQVIVLLWAVSVQQLVLLGGGGTAVAGRTDPDPDLHADLKGGAAADASVDVVGRGSREGGEDEEAGEDEEEVIRLLSILMARLACMWKLHNPGSIDAATDGRHVSTTDDGHRHQGDSEPPPASPRGGRVGGSLPPGLAFPAAEALAWLLAGPAGPRVAPMVKGLPAGLLAALQRAWASGGGCGEGDATTVVGLRASYGSRRAAMAAAAAVLSNRGLAVSPTRQRDGQIATTSRQARGQPQARGSDVDPEGKACPRLRFAGLERAPRKRRNVGSRLPHLRLAHQQRGRQRSPPNRPPPRGSRPSPQHPSSSILSAPSAGGVDGRLPLVEDQRKLPSGPPPSGPEGPPPHFLLPSSSGAASSTGGPPSVEDQLAAVLRSLGYCPAPPHGEAHALLPLFPRTGEIACSHWLLSTDSVRWPFVSCALCVVRVHLPPLKANGGKWSPPHSPI